MRWNVPDALREDEAIYRLVSAECARQEAQLELIASENFVSPAVLAALGSPLTNKYAEGYPGRRYYGGCEMVDQAEALAIDRARALFHCEHANVQPHAGSQANMAAYQAILRPGDRVLGMDLNGGGHLTHGSSFNFSGSLYDFRAYGLNEETQRIDYDALRRLARDFQPKLIVAGASAYPRTIDFAAFRAVCDEVGAYLMVDMAHIAGLVAAGLHPSPVPYADIVTTTTHKTLRGPRGGMILCKAKLAKAVGKAVFPGTQGGPLMHVIAAKAVCFYEALQPDFAAYQQKILDNARALADGLTQNGVKLVSGGTDNHLMLIDLRDTPVTGAQAEKWLGEAHITVNKNMVPGDTRKPGETSGIRLGTPAVTTRGLDAMDMRLLAGWIADILRKGEAAVPRVGREAEKMLARYPLYRA